MKALVVATGIVLSFLAVLQLLYLWFEVCVCACLNCLLSCAVDGVLAWPCALQVQLQAVPHHPPPGARCRVEEALQTLRLSETFPPRESLSLIGSHTLLSNETVDSLLGCGHNQCVLFDSLPSVLSFMLSLPLYPPLSLSVSISLSRPQLILKDVDSLLYVDSDVVFLEPVDALWAFLTDFNSTQLVAMAPEHEEPRIAWYNRFARHPYYGRTGINSGVMLMNMTRIRSTYFKVRGQRLTRMLSYTSCLNSHW